MFTSVEVFKDVWKHETDDTARLLDKLTDAGLNRPQMESVRTVGRAAWHIVLSQAEMAPRFGLKVTGPGANDPVPAKAADIKKAYRDLSRQILEQVGRWKEADLQKEDDMYGQVWKRGKSLWVLLAHEIHHRGQLTVLMRLAEVPVVGIYGPAKEEWDKYGAPPPAV